jgi:hypothetical protein
MIVEQIALMEKPARTNFRIASYVLCYLTFFEFITISIKEATGLEFIGAARDALLILIAYFGIYKYKRSSILLYLIVLAAYGVSLWNPDARPFANLVSAFVIGCTVKTNGRPYRMVLLALIVICALTILYQSFNITDFEQFWFYNYLSNKEGDLFLATQYAYFRGDGVRPTGLMISPSVMGLALIGLGHIYKTSIRPHKNPYIVYAIILICLQLIQTRALIIGYVFYVFIEINIKRVSSKAIALLYFAATVVVFLTIVYVGDDSAYVRVLLLYSVFEYLSSGVLFPYLQADQSIVVDSQLIGFFYLAGIAGLIFLAMLYRRAIKAASSPAELISFNFFSFCIFISVFQWSYDSFGLLVGLYSLGTIFNKYRLPFRSAGRR